MRFPFLTLFVISMCSLRAYAAPPPAPFSDLELDAAKLKNWETRSYAMTRTAVEDGAPVTQRVGQMSLNCDVKEGTIRLVNTAKMFMPDGKQFIEFRQECVYPKLNLRALSEINTNVARSDGVQLMKSQGTVEGKEMKVVGEEGGRDSETKFPWPENGIVDLAVFYFVTILPREADRRYKIEHYISGSRLQEVEPQVIECQGPDRATGEPNKPWIKFTLYHPDKPAEAVQYWVSDDGILQRVQLNKENRMDLEADEKGKDQALKNDLPVTNGTSAKHKPGMTTQQPHAIDEANVAEPKYFVQRTNITIEPREDVLRELGVSAEDFQTAMQQPENVRQFQSVIESTDTLQPKSFAGVSIFLAEKQRRLLDVAKVVLETSTED